VQRPVAAARTRVVLCDPFFASTGQANPTHCRHWAQAGRPPYGWELIASGTASVDNPSRTPASASSRAGAVSGRGGIGKSRDRGASAESPAVLPQTPISHSARL
jgi:hypothetical protein